MDRRQILNNTDTQVDIDKPRFTTPAVSVQNGFKAYTKGTPILNDFNMTVPRGTIYGLLGASGCGKTTMLSCIVGLRELDSGRILVYGSKPGTRESGIPGKKLGYMPQDIALYPHFTIKELLQYFGRIYGMRQLEILNRIEFLTNFLHLPDSTRMVANLSGGQQRRTSLSVAMLAEPELLILDEPTVGVDPLLRENIWDHLVSLTERGRTTVIITTHYIEEARQSHTVYGLQDEDVSKMMRGKLIKVGLMRNGRLLTEKAPDALLLEHNANLLEDIVMQLCKKDQNVIDETILNGKGADPVRAALSEISFYSKRRILPNFSKSKGEYNLQNQDNGIEGLKYKRKFSMKPGDANLKRRQSIIEIVNDEAKAQRNRIKALIIRNVINFGRNPVFLFGMLLLPLFQCVLTVLTVGKELRDVKFGIVNKELPDWDEVCGYDESGCKSGGINFQNISCRYLKALPHEILDLVPYESQEAARYAVTQGELWGYLTVPDNYSQHMVERSTDGNFATNTSLIGSTLLAKLDQSHYMAAALMIETLFTSFERYVRDLGVECGGHAQEFELPLHYRKPVYGKDKAQFIEFIVPGALTMLLFLIPMCSCSLAYISDKKQGTMERSRSAGVTTFDFMMAFFFTEGLVIIIQTTLCTALLVMFFDFRVEGSYFIYTLLCILAGLSGQSWGFILGLLSSDETSALLTAFFLYMPMLVLTGITWPLEAVPHWLRYFSYCLPGTLPTASMRSVVLRGLGFTHPLVWPGFVTIIVWILISWIISLIVYRITK